MKALVVVPRTRTVELIDLPAPGAPGSGQVRVRTRQVGLCGTDKEIARFSYGTPPRGSDILILGHECIGEVCEVGPGVESLRVGDRVVPRVRRPCLHDRCAPCRAGRSDYCVTGDFREHGIKELHGFACEEWTDAEIYLHRVEPELGDVAVLTEPLTIAEKAMVTVGIVQSRLPQARDPRRSAVVIGGGPVGQLGAMVLRHAGYDVHLLGRAAAVGSIKAEALARIGAVYVSGEEVPASALPQRAGPIELVYEAAGASATAFEVLAELAPNGIFVFTGVPGRKQPLQLDGAALMKSLVLENKVVVGTVNAGPDAFEAAIADLRHFQSRWPGALAGLVTHRHTPEDAPRLLREGFSDGIKHVVVFAGD
jgi:glucose 1-dehydrogenase